MIEDVDRYTAEELAGFIARRTILSSYRREAMRGLAEAHLPPTYRLFNEVVSHLDALWLRATGRGGGNA